MIQVIRFFNLLNPVIWDCIYAEVTDLGDLNFANGKPADQKGLAALAEVIIKR
jgi:hypothetical protein